MIVSAPASDPDYAHADGDFLLDPPRLNARMSQIANSPDADLDVKSNFPTGK